MHRTFHITIEGIAPLIQDNPAESDLKQLGAINGTAKRSASKQDESETWRSKVYPVPGQEKLGHPARAFESLVKEAAVNFKASGRKTMKAPVRQCCWVDGDWLVITNRKQPDDVMVSTPQTQSGRVPSYLPVFAPGWRMEFDYQLTDDEIVTPQHLHKIITWGGERIGLGKAAYRPKYGRFIIVGWEEVEQKETVQN